MNDLSQYKVPPHSPEAENSVLCSCLINPDHLDHAVSLLSPEDFYSSAHKKIFAAIASLHLGKKPVDLNSVSVALRESNHIEEIGGSAYLSSLTDGPQAHNVEHFCNIIRKYATARRMIAAGNEITRMGFEATTDTVSEKTDKAHALVTELTINATQGAHTSASDLMVQTNDRYEGMNAGTNRTGIKTGFYEIDLLTGGFRNSRLIIIAARPRMGKTALMLNMAVNMARCGRRVGIHSLEMDKEELADRMIAAETGINSVRLSMGTGPNAEEWPKVNDAMSQISGYRVRIDDTGGLPIKELKARIRNWKKDGVDIVFIDQLSKIRGDRRKSRFEQATEIVEELAWLKKELRMPIVLLAQINRKAEERHDRKPTLADLKNTGQLEEDADIILLGNRAYEYTKAPEDENKATWELAKHRGGPCRMIEMGWNAKTTTFYQPENRIRYGG